MLNKLLNLNWGLGPLAVHALLQLVIFMTKQNLLEKSSTELMFTAYKYSRMQCTLFLPTWVKSLTKFYPKLQDFKRVLGLNLKGCLMNLIFSTAI